MRPRLSEYERGRILDHLSTLAADAEGVELVAALVKGSRASFTIAEAADLLSVSPRHLYANVTRTGFALPSVEVVRSGDRMVIPAHRLRAALGLPEPHGTNLATCTVETLSPHRVAAIAETISFMVLTRLEAAELITVPDLPDAQLRANMIGAQRD